MLWNFKSGKFLWRSDDRQKPAPPSEVTRYCRAAGTVIPGQATDMAPREIALATINRMLNPQDAVKHYYYVNSSEAGPDCLQKGKYTPDSWKLPVPMHPLNRIQVRHRNGHIGDRLFAISPDGKRALSDWKGTLLYWDLETGRLIRKLVVRGGQPLTFSIAFSSDGKRALVGHATHIVLWGLGKGIELRHLKALKPEEEPGPESFPNRERP